MYLVFGFDEEEHPEYFEYDSGRMPELDDMNEILLILSDHFMSGGLEHNPELLNLIDPDLGNVFESLVQLVQPLFQIESRELFAALL